MSISRHVDQYCAVRGIVQRAELDVQTMPSCFEFLPVPGIEVVCTDSGSRLAAARSLVYATLSAGGPDFTPNRGDVPCDS